MSAARYAPVPRARHAVLAAVALTAALEPLAAQAPLDGRAGWQVSPSFEHWSFGCCADSSFGGGVRRALEWTVPLVGARSVGRNVTVDAYAAWTRAEVALRGSSAIPPRTLHVEGLTDAKVRASVRFGGRSGGNDTFLATVGVNVPTGKTSLDAEELAVLRVVGAPPLRFQTPALGTGWGGTTGLVYTRRIAGWSWGLGASYEYRGKYAPAQAAALGLGSGDLDLEPGQAVRLSLGADGLVGESAMTISVSSTLYTEDRVSFTGTGRPPDPVRLGPMFTAEWQLRAASWLFRELSVYAFDRYRTRYRRSGAAVDGTDGNELELGLHGLVPLAPELSLVAGIRGRHHSGLSIDNSIATAAAVSGGVSVGLAWRAGSMVLTPAIGAELGRMDTGESRVSMHKLEAMFTILMAQ